jgi:hypothetical protein
MTFAPPLHRVVENVDRRVLGAFQLVDAVTHLPVRTAAKVEVRSAALVGAGAPVNVPLHERSLVIQQNRSGFHTIIAAPFFEEYSTAFDDAVDPPETPPGTQLRLRLAIIEAGPQYLPQEFAFDLPRPRDRGVPDNVFVPMAVEIFRAPGAPVLGGWSALRVRVMQVGTGEPLPGVLVRVFRSPRVDADRPIGSGVTDWRERLRGEALVAVADLLRFRPGAGADVFVTSQAVHLEAVRDTAFTGAAGAISDVSTLLTSNAPQIVRRRSNPPGPLLTVEPPAPFDIEAGGEITVRITMP